MKCLYVADLCTNIEVINWLIIGSRDCGDYVFYCDTPVRDGMLVENAANKSRVPLGT